MHVLPTARNLYLSGPFSGISLVFFLCWVWLMQVPIQASEASSYEPVEYYKQAPKAAFSMIA